jgi:glycosyltransferase involved in cell wall biosynthesis
MEHKKLRAMAYDQDQKDINSDGSVEISVIVPVSERHDDLRELYLQCSKEFANIGKSYEFIFVLDGPQTGAFGSLRELKKENPDIKIILLNRWFGEATALSAGFERSRGAIIFTLASYFQVEPAEVHRMYKMILDEGNDLVISWRYPRIDSLFNRCQSAIFHRLIRILTGTKYHDISCGLRAMKRKVIEEISLYGDLHRFFPLLAFQRGFKVKEIAVKQSRQDSKTRIFGIGVYLRRLLDIITLFFLFKFTKKPLRFFGLIGSVVAGMGAIITAYLGLYRLLGLGGIADRPLLILGVLLIVVGVQLFSIGLLGEIIIFTHARGVKEYQIEEFLE